MQWQVDHLQHIVSTQHHFRNKIAAALAKGKQQTPQWQLGDFQRMRAPHALGNLITWEALAM